jgi:hypothetical protein
VEYLINETAQRHGHILVSPRLFCLKTADTLLMKELAIQPKIENYFLMPVNDTLMLLKPNARLEKLVTDLRNLGYMPRLEQTGVKSTAGVQLSETDQFRILGLLKAFELADTLRPELADSLSQLDGVLLPTHRELLLRLPDEVIDQAAERLKAFNRKPVFN